MEANDAAPAADCPTPNQPWSSRQSRSRIPRPLSNTSLNSWNHEDGNAHVPAQARTRAHRQEHHHPSLSHHQPDEEHTVSNSQFQIVVTAPDSTGTADDDESYHGNASVYPDLACESGSETVRDDEVDVATLHDGGLFERDLGADALLKNLESCKVHGEGIDEDGLTVNHPINADRSDGLSGAVAPVHLSSQPTLLAPVPVVARPGTPQAPPVGGFSFLSAPRPSSRSRSPSPAPSSSSRRAIRKFYRQQNKQVEAFQDALQLALKAEREEGMGEEHLLGRTQKNSSDMGQNIDNANAASPVSSSSNHHGDGASDKFAFDQSARLHDRLTAEGLRRATRIAVEGSLILTVTLTLLKGIVAISSDSLSMTASAVDSGLDALSQALLVWTTRFIRRPDALQYPIGKATAESITGNDSACIHAFA